MSNEVEELRAQINAQQMTIETLKRDIAKLQLAAKLTPAPHPKIAEILEYFDFDKVHQAMVALDWKWTDEYDKKAVPTVDDLREGAVHWMKSALELAGDSKEEHFTGSGGFMATADGYGNVKLQFILEEWDTREEA